MPNIHSARLGDEIRFNKDGGFDTTVVIVRREVLKFLKQNPNITMEEFEMDCIVRGWATYEAPE